MANGYAFARNSGISLGFSWALARPKGKGANGAVRRADVTAMQGGAVARRLAAERVEQPLQGLESRAIGLARDRHQHRGQRPQTHFARRRGQRLGIQQHLPRSRRARPAPAPPRSPSPGSRGPAPGAPAAPAIRAAESPASSSAALPAADFTRSKAASLVHGIVQPVLARRAEIIAQSRAAEAQQRPRHRRPAKPGNRPGRAARAWPQARPARCPAPAEQKGFGLVVFGVADKQGGDALLCHPGAHQPIARLTRQRLDAGFGFLALPDQDMRLQAGPFRPGATFRASLAEPCAGHDPPSAPPARAVCAPARSRPADASRQGNRRRPKPRRRRAMACAAIAAANFVLKLIWCRPFCGGRGLA